MMLPQPSWSRFSRSARSPAARAQKRRWFGGQDFFGPLESRVLFSTTTPMDTSSAWLPGDANMDGTVDVVDLGIVASNYDTTGASWATGDFNGDGIVNIGDLGVLATNYGHTLGTHTESVTASMDQGVVTIKGTSGNDMVVVTQTGSTVTITSGMSTWTFSNVTRIRAFMGDGDDIVKLDPSVSVPAELYGEGGDDTLYGGSGENLLSGGPGNNTIYGGTGSNRIYAGEGVNRVYGGPGDDILVSIGSVKTTLTGGGGNDSFWVGSGDTITDASSTELNGGYVHVISQFYQPWTTDPTNIDYVGLSLNGPNIRDPLATDPKYTYQSYAGNLLFSGTPSYTDIHQGKIGDCYFLATIGAFAQSNPDVIRNSIVDLGDGTYAVRFYQSGTEVYVRVDADLPSYQGAPAYEALGPNGALWAPLMEKAWAYIRTDANSYNSITTGWMNEVYRALTGRTSTSYYVAGMAGPDAYSTVSSLLSSGYALTLGSKGTATSPILVNHAYIIVGADTDAQGTQWITLYNTYGYDGYTWDSNPGDGLLRLQASMIPQYFSSMVAINPS